MQIFQFDGMVHPYLASESCKQNAAELHSPPYLHVLPYHLAHQQGATVDVIVVVGVIGCRAGA